MKVVYKKEVDVLMIQIAEGKVAESEESKPGVIIDYDQEGNILRIEILNASKHSDSPHFIDYELIA
ncbi:MAG: DUF2283 domain-containing protein [Cyclobacteriaceae bacterium]|jgi:uncharacterized protein YuzE|nr:DUF2283 domain-containing protein [Algoriphagus marincola]MCR9084559.1 DUF2283 domain-containing protein [Cyclobacteriaceae bacterium]